MRIGGRRIGVRGGVVAVAALASVAPLCAQPLIRDERQQREADIRLSQQSPRALINNGVIQRERTAYYPTGLPIGGLRLYPSLTGRIGYDSNVFNIPDGDGDLVARIEPALALRSDWTRHAFSIDATAAAERFARLTGNDVETHDLTARGTIDIGRGGHLGGSLRAARQIEARGSIGEQFQGGEPIRFRLHEGTVNGSLFIPGLRAAFDVRTTGYRYKDVLFRGTRFPQDFRNRRETFSSGEVAVLIGPQLSLFSRIDVNDANYRVGPGVVDFSSHGYSAIGGVTFQLLGMLSGEAGIGYLRQTYDILPLPTIDGLSYDVGAVWNVTPLLTISGRGQRTVQQTAFIASPSVVSSVSTLRFDYELLRNVLVNLNLSATDFRYARSTRSDRLYNGFLSVRLLLSRWLTAEVAFDGRKQNARSTFARSYQGGSFRLGVTIQR